MPGFGTQYAGITSAGTGTPIDSPTPGQAYAVNPGIVAARRIDLRVKDYAADEDTLGAPFEATDPVDQQVVLALTTRRGDIAALPDFGLDFFNLPKLPANPQLFVQRDVERALADLLRDGKVQLLAVEVQVEGSTAVLSVTYQQPKTKRLVTVRVS